MARKLSMSEEKQEGKIDGRKSRKGIPRTVTTKVKANQLAQVLTKYWFRNGCVNMEIPKDIATLKAIPSKAKGTVSIVGAFDRVMEFVSRVSMEQAQKFLEIKKAIMPAAGKDTDHDVIVKEIFEKYKDELSLDND